MRVAWGGPLALPQPPSPVFPGCVMVLAPSPTPRLRSMCLFHFGLDMLPELEELLWLPALPGRLC